MAWQAHEAFYRVMESREIHCPNCKYRHHIASSLEPECQSKPISILPNYHRPALSPSQTASGRINDFTLCEGSQNFSNQPFDFTHASLPDAPLTPDFSPASLNFADGWPQDMLTSVEIDTDVNTRPKGTDNTTKLLQQASDIESKLTSPLITTCEKTLSPSQSFDSNTDSKPAQKILRLNQIDAALHLAARDGQTSIVSILLSSGAKVDSVNDKGQTTLHVCVENGHVEVMEVLLDWGANVSILDSDGVSVISTAVKTGKEKIVEVLARNIIMNTAIGA